MFMYYSRKVKIRGKRILYGYSSKEEGDFKRDEHIVKFLRIFFSSPLIITMKQRHTSKILHVSHLKNPISSYENCDGLFYSHPRKNVFLIVKTADCLPILVWDRKGNLGVAHAGWKGSFERILNNLLHEFLHVSEPNEIYMFIGPGIESCCYPIYGERLSRFREKFSLWQNYFIVPYPTHLGLDLKKLNILQAISAGIPIKNIFTSSICTSCNVNNFFSYRSEGKVKGNIISWIGLIG